MQKLVLITLVLFLFGCTTTTKQPTEPITYSVLETTPNELMGNDYKLPGHIRTLPIPLFTWYPQGSTIHTLDGVTAITGRFVWLDGCLLFNIDNTAELITPIFWVNTIKDYQTYGNQGFLTLHNDQIVYLNHQYPIKSPIEPNQNSRTKQIIQRGQDKCLMDNVIYLGAEVVN